MNVFDQTGSTGTISVTTADSSAIVFNTPTLTYSGSTEDTKVKSKAEIKDGKVVNPRIYFKFIKEKFTKLEANKLEKRLKTISEHVKSLKECGQQAAYEEFSKLMVICARECEALALGFDKYVIKADILKFKKYQNLSEIVNFENLEDFKRPLPKKAINKLKKCQEHKLFDEYHVLSLDYSGEEKLKTNKQKIKEKDPILFGKYAYEKTRYYYICDWVDEYCDLTIDKFIDEVAKINDNVFDKPCEYDLKERPEITPEYLDAMKKEVMDKYDRLDNTKMSNYRDNMAKEDEENGKRKRKKRSFMSKFKFWK